MAAMWFRMRFNAQFRKTSCWAFMILLGMCLPIPVYADAGAAAQEKDALVLLNEGLMLRYWYREAMLWRNEGLSTPAELSSPEYSRIIPLPPLLQWQTTAARRR